MLHALWKRMPLRIPLMFGLAMIASGPAARADLVVVDAGTTTFDTGSPTADGDVSYVVLQNTDTSQSWVDTLGLSGWIQPLAPSATVDENSSYIYLYQVNNSDPNTSGGDDALTAFTVVSGGGTVTSFAYIDDAELVPGSDPASVISSSGTTVSPTAASTPESGFRFFFFVDPANGLFDGSLTPGSTSSILVATSNVGPTTTTGILDDLGQATGDVAAPTPEPGTWMALASCVPLGLIPLRRRWIASRK